MDRTEAYEVAKSLEDWVQAEAKRKRRSVNHDSPEMVAVRTIKELTSDAHLMQALHNASAAIESMRERLTQKEELHKTALLNHNAETKAKCLRLERELGMAQTKVEQLDKRCRELVYAKSCLTLNLNVEKSRVEHLVRTLKIIAVLCLCAGSITLLTVVAQWIS